MSDALLRILTIVDEMGATDPMDPQLQVLFHRALEVWRPNWPAITLL